MNVQPQSSPVARVCNAASWRQEAEDLQEHTRLLIPSIFAQWYSDSVFGGVATVQKMLLR